MRKALSVSGNILGVAFKIAFIGLLFVGHFIMNIVGLLICAITEG